jgi:hypothetical protein
MAEANFSAALSTWKGQLPSLPPSHLANPATTPKAHDTATDTRPRDQPLRAAKSLDKTALEVVDNQKENMVGRKKLAEQTRGVNAEPGVTSSPPRSHGPS